jgi:hypothetical protein
VAAIFGPRSSHLRAELAAVFASNSSTSGHSSATETQAGNLSSSASTLSDEPVTKGCSAQQLIAGKPSEEAVQLLLVENARLCAENDSLSKKCAQLQSKVPLTTAPAEYCVEFILCL